MQNKLQTYYVVNFLYNFARVLPHAVLTILLLAKGVSLAEISLIQSFYMLVALISEFPSGVITELIGEKKMYQLSLVLLGLSYFGVFLFDNVFMLSIVWGIYGLSAATISGTLDAYFYKKIKQAGENIKKFNVSNRYSLLVSSLVGALIGSFLYKLIGIKIYLLSIAIIILALLLLSFFIKIEKVDNVQEIQQVSVKNQVTQIVKETIALKNDAKLLALLLLICIFQIVVQLYFQYWQVFFKDKGIQVAYFGVAYALFQIVAIISTYLFAKIRIDNKPVRYIISLICLVGVSLIISIFTPNIFFFALSFSVFLLAFNIYDNVLEYLMLHQVKSSYMSSFMSLFGSLSTVVSTIILWIMTVFLSFESLAHVSFILIIVFMIISFVVSYQYYLAVRNVSSQKLSMLQEDN